MKKFLKKQKLLFLTLACVISLALLSFANIFFTKTAVATDAETTDDTIAMIGETGYSSLKEAVDAALDGEEVKLVSNFTFTIDSEEEVTDLAGKYKTYALIFGKSITVDLNGFTIDCTVNAANSLINSSPGLVGFFSTDGNGRLTVNDSSAQKTGKIKMTATSKVYSLFANYSSGSSIVVNGGTYELDEAGDSLVYSGSNTKIDKETGELEEGVVINDGTYILGNVDTGSNGSPWLFNASGKNDYNILVNGGSFNDDVSRQYWRFEAIVTEAVVLINDEGTGLWNSVTAAFIVNEQEWSGGWYTYHTGYATLEKAFAAATPDPQTNGSQVSEAEYITVLDDFHLTDETLSELLANKNVKIVFEKDLYIETDFTLPEDATFVVNGNVNVYEDFTNLGTLTGGEDTTINLVEITVSDDLTYSSPSFTSGENSVLESVSGPIPVYTSNDEDFYEIAENDYIAVVNPINGAATLHTTLLDAITKANEYEDGSTVSLLSDETFASMLTVSSPIAIKGNNFTLTRDDAYTGTFFKINAGASLTLENLTIDGGNEWTFNQSYYDEALKNRTSGTAWADFAKTEEGAPVLSAAMFIVNGALSTNGVTIKNSFSTKDNNSGDASIFKVEANATLTMDDTTVTHVATGGANSVAHLASGSVWTINDGTIISETFAGRNGGVCRSDNGKLVMNGGEIKNNHSINTNGTVLMLYGTNSIFELNDGLICSNSGISGTANGRCAPIYLHSGSSFIMTGGSICHNTGVNYGGLDGGQSSSSATIQGGSIENNVSMTGSPFADVNTLGSITISGGSFTQDVTKWLDDKTYLTYDENTNKFSSVSLENGESLLEIQNLESGFLKRYLLTGEKLLSSTFSSYLLDEKFDGLFPSFYSTYSVVEGTTVYSDDDKLDYSTVFSQDGASLTKVYVVWTAATDVELFVTISEENLYYRHGEPVELEWSNKENSPLTFTATYQDNENAGTATMLLTEDLFGISFSVPYEILPLDISTSNAVINLTNQLVYNGSEQTQELQITVNNLPVTFSVENSVAKDAGNYFLTVTGTGNYSGSIYVYFTVLNAQISDDANDDGVDEIVIKDTGGFNPSVNLIVEIVSPDEMSDYGLTKRETPKLAYRVMFQSRSVVRLTETATTKLLIPKELKNKDFKLYHYVNDEMVELNPLIDGDYAIVSVDGHSEFVFVTEKNPALIPACLLLIIIILETIIMMLVLKGKNKTNKKNKKSKTYSSALGVLPLFLSLFLKEEIILLSALAVIAVSLIAVLIVIAIRSKNNSLKITELHEQVDALREKINHNLENIELLEKKLAAASVKVDNAVLNDEIVATATEVSDDSSTLRESLNRSFTARLIQSSDECKNYYQSIKNALLSYKKVKSKVSWNYESVTAGRTKLAKMVLRGKTLKVYFALNPANYENTKFKVEEAKGNAYLGVPCLYKITSARKAKYALELIADLAKIHGLTEGVTATETLSLPYESDEALLEKGLIKRDFLKNFR